jgi:hypothetical protein
MRPAQSSGGASLARALRRGRGAGPRLRISSKRMTLQQFGRRVHALGEKDVRSRIVIIDVYFARMQSGSQGL